MPYPFFGIFPGGSPAAVLALISSGERYIVPFLEKNSLFAWNRGFGQGGVPKERRVPMAVESVSNLNPERRVKALGKTATLVFVLPGI